MCQYVYKKEILNKVPKATPHDVDRALFEQFFRNAYVY